MWQQSGVLLGLPVTALTWIVRDWSLIPQKFRHRIFRITDCHIFDPLLQQLWIENSVSSRKLKIHRTRTKHTAGRSLFIQATYWEWKGGRNWFSFSTSEPSDITHQWLCPQFATRSMPVIYSTGMSKTIGYCSQQPICIIRGELWWQASFGSRIDNNSKKPHETNPTMESRVNRPSNNNSVLRMSS